MATPTQHYGLERLAPGDDLSVDDWRFGGADRTLIDRLLYLALSGHHHTGLPVVDGVAPVAGPILTPAVGSGTLPAGVEIFYSFAFVDSGGGEGPASPATSVTTQDPVDSPDAPTIARIIGGGALLPGQYFYALSAYRGFNTLETPMGDAQVAILPPVDGDTQQVQVTLPALPTGADGFNVYRRSPGLPYYVYLASVIGPDAGSPYIDTGLVEDDCNRLAPSTNTTANTSTVQIDLPEALPAGYTWRIYRTYLVDQWSSTLLTEVAPATTSFIDVGGAVGDGDPILNIITVTQPQPINLDPAAGEVVGALGPTQIAGSPEIVTFAFPGSVVTTTGSFSWECPYANVSLRDISLNLGRGSLAGASGVVVDALKGAAGVGFASLFPGSYPAIGSGANSSGPVDITTNPGTPLTMTTGDQLSIDIVDADGAGTDLLVTVRLWVHETTDPF